MMKLSHILLLALATLTWPLGIAVGVHPFLILAVAAVAIVLYRKAVEPGNLPPAGATAWGVLADDSELRFEQAARATGHPRLVGTVGGVATEVTLRGAIVGDASGTKNSTFITAQVPWLAHVKLQSRGPFPHGRRLSDVTFDKLFEVQRGELNARQRRSLCSLLKAASRTASRAEWGDSGGVEVSVAAGTLTVRYLSRAAGNNEVAAVLDWLRHEAADL